MKVIGGYIGEVIEVESDGIVWDKSARVKVMLDISKPLRRIHKIRREGMFRSNSSTKGCLPFVMSAG